MNYDVVEVVIDRLIHFFNLREWQYDIEDCVEDIAEALKHIGASKVFEEKAFKITINSKVGRLPSGCQNIKHAIPISLPYRESGSFIEVDLPDGAEVVLVCQVMPVDARGYVLVPDNTAVREALVWYMAKILVLRGEIKTVTFQYAEQEWQWRCGSARAELNVWNMQQAYQVYQNFTRLNPLKDVHENNYEGLSQGNTLDRTKSLDETP